MSNVTVFNVAAGLAQLSGWRRSNLELQKLCYFAQLLYLGKYSKPLFNEGFEAWHYGPVCPDLYHKLKICGANVVSKSVVNEYLDKPHIDDFMKAVAKETADMTAAKMISITHWSEGAWSKNYKPKFPSAEISHDDILEEYKKRAEIKNAR